MDAEKVDRVEKQLNHHLNNRKCESCTVKGKSYADCFDNLFTDAMSVIRELKAENERLKQEKADMVKQITELDIPCVGIRSYKAYMQGFSDAITKAIDIINEP